jgi:dephospho-CoA kinase
MLRVGLTGGIGSGKSTVAKVFEVLGIPVYYADEAARKIINEDDALKLQIIAHFGEQAYTEGKLNRGYIAGTVFGDARKLDALNAITHPAVIQHSESWMSKQSGPYAIREAALIFESGIDKYLDQVIGVSCPEWLRIERTTQRDQISPEEVLKRIRSQMDETEKMQRCDFIIDNDGSQMLIPQVLRLHEQLLSLTDPH